MGMRHLAESLPYYAGRAVERQAKQAEEQRQAEERQKAEPIKARLLEAAAERWFRDNHVPPYARATSKPWAELRESLRRNYDGMSYSYLIRLDEHRAKQEQEAEQARLLRPRSSPSPGM